MRINHSTNLQPSTGLGGCNIYFGIPTYDNKVVIKFNTSMVNTALHLKDRGIGMQMMYSKGDAFIDRGRNSLIDNFLKSPCTHLCMIDADQGWDHEKIYEMIKCDKDFIAAAVHQKALDPSYAIRVNVDKNKRCVEKDGLISTHRIGMALCIIKREVFEKIKENNTLIETINNGTMFTDIHLHYIPGRGYDWVGEDFDFCDKCIKSGVDIWIYPDINVTHVGQYEFEGNFHEYLCKQPGGKYDKEKLSNGLRINQLQKEIT